MPPRGKKKTKASRKRSASRSRKTSAARKTKRTARSRAGAARKTSARKTATPRRRAAKRPAKRTAKRTAKPAARRRIPAQSAPSAPAFGGGMAGEPDEIVILSTEELIDETDIDLGGDEGGGDDDLEGM